MIKKTSTALCGLISGLLVLAAILNAPAATIIQAASVSTTMGELGTFIIGNAIDQSGLSSTYTSGVTDFDTFTAATSHDSSNANNDWISNVGTGNVDFDLGGTFSIESLAFWGNGTDAGRITGFNLLADDNALFSSATNLGSFVRVGTGAAATTPAEIFSFASTSASHVRMQITSVAGASFAIIGEVAFENVPEPSRALLSLVGLGAIVLRRRRS